MIYFTENSSQNIEVGRGVQRSNGELVPHENGDLVGFIMNTSLLQNGEYQLRVYVAGGGGAQMLLGSSWDGTTTRFTVSSGRVLPVSSGGVGWLIAEYPSFPRQEGELVTGALYA